MEVINSAVAAANTDLESLSVGNHIIVLDDDETNYSVTISEHTAVTTITASAEYQQAEVSIQIDDRVTKSVRTAAEQISLDEGQSKEVEIVVSENNEMTTKQYIVHVFREKSSDKRLSRLAVSPESNRSVHSIKAGDSEYIKDGNNFISLMPDEEVLISDIIPLKRIDETVIEIVMRVPCDLCIQLIKICYC